MGFNELWNIVREARIGMGYAPTREQHELFAKVHRWATEEIRRLYIGTANTKEIAS